MGYKIEYSPEYTKTILTDKTVKFTTLLLFFAAGLFVAGILLHGRGVAIDIVAVLEEMAGQLQQGDSVVDVFASFSEAVQGVYGG